MAAARNRIVAPLTRFLSTPATKSLTQTVTFFKQTQTQTQTPLKLNQARVQSLCTQSQSDDAIEYSVLNKYCPGFNYTHWLVLIDEIPENDTRDDLIQCYINTLAQVLGSEDEAKKKIYSVSTKFYYGFGANVNMEVAEKLKAHQNVEYVLPDGYVDDKNKTYRGEPFINGKAVPYDPKYHPFVEMRCDHIWSRKLDSNSIKSDISLGVDVGEQGPGCIRGGSPDTDNAIDGASTDTTNRHSTT